MGKSTGIQWADDTVNCTSGCDGCELWKLLESQADVGLRIYGGPCYAGNLQEQRLSKSLPHLYSSNFTEVRMIPGRMHKAAGWSDLTGTNRADKPWLNGLPRIIFVDDLGDLFSRAVTFDFIKAEVIDTAMSKRGSRHVWMLLTKQPLRMAEFDGWLASRGIAWPNNVMAGTSITTQKTLSRVRQLVKVRARHRFLSVEPQWEEISLASILWTEVSETDPTFKPVTTRNIHLVIQGGESDQGPWKAHPFDLAWARSLRAECRAAGVPYFMKQLGSRVHDSSRRTPMQNLPIVFKDHHGGEWEEWEEGLRVREFPAVTGYTPAPDRSLLF
jgi:protein gp37